MPVRCNYFIVYYQFVIDFKIRAFICKKTGHTVISARFHFGRPSPKVFHCLMRDFFRETRNLIPRAPYVTRGAKKCPFLSGSGKPLPSPVYTTGINFGRGNGQAPPIP